SLNQVLLLVVVNVEVIEHVDSTALISTNGIVSQIDDQTNEIATLGTPVTLELRNSDDIAHTQLTSESRLISVQGVANIILKQQHVSQGVLTREQSRIAAALVVLAALDDGANGLLSFRIGIITGTHIDLEFDGVQVLIRDDGTDAVLVDLVIGRRQPTIANQASAGDFLFELMSHLLLPPGDHIKLGNVDNVIAIHPLLLVNSGRRSRTLQQTEHLLLLEVALDVTLGSSIILGQVREGSAEPAERSMVNAVHNSTNPRLVVIQNLGRSVQFTLIREQPIQLINTMGQERILHAAIALRIGDCRLDISRVLEAVVGGIAFENIVLHRIILL